MTATMPRDPYEVLGLSKSASADDVQKAYRKLARKFHPDRNPGDKQAEASFKEVSAAYETLSDPAKKENFDRFGFAGPPPGGGGFPGGGFPGGVNFGGPGGGVNVDPQMAEELFKNLFGGAGGHGGGPDLGDLFGGGGGGRRGRAGGRHRATGRRAEPVEHEVTVPFHVAANGGTVNIEVEGREIGVKVPAGIDEGKKLACRPKRPGRSRST